MLDPLDQRLLHALQLDGRAPFSRIAAVLDVADRTVARRFARLRAVGGIRVSGVPNSDVTGHAEWLVRMRVRPHATAGLARALADRADTAWVTVLSSGVEVVCLFRVPGSGPAPLAELSRYPHATVVGAQRVLRHLMDHRWRGRTVALTDDEVAALRPPHPDVPVPTRLTDLDRRLFPALAADGRATCAELAKQVDWSESAVRRRLAELRDAALLQFHVEVEPALYGFSAQCLLWLTVTPSMLGTVAARLAEDTETAYVGAITGDHNLLAIVICRNTHALYTHLTERIGSLKGIERTATADITAYTKRFAPTTAVVSGR